MFKKLRNMFLLLNLVSISAMMILSFASIYAITYTDIQGDIGMELRRASDAYRKPGDIATRPPSDAERRPPSPDTAPPRKERIPNDLSVSFVVIVDETGTVKKAYSIFDIDDTFFEDAVRLAHAKNNDRGSIKLDGSHWAFITFPGADGLRMTFLDVTSQQAILTQLVYTFLGAAAVMLVFIFFLSKYFAERAIAPIAESFEKQKRFIADASHELRTPLAVIASNVDVLLSGSVVPAEEQKKWLGHIKYESELMAKLTNDLLYLTLMDHSEETDEYTPVDMSGVVENTVLSMEAVFYEEGLALSHSVEPHLMCLGNPERLARVVMILLENALKYSSSEGHVLVNTTRRNQMIVLSVENTGPGIDSEHIERIFDRFYRTDAARSRRSGSYGLGLAIAKEIIDQHKGRIYVTSAESDRTTFFVELPVAS